MENFLNFLLDRMKERSTWLGLISLLTGFGLAISPEQGESIVSMGVSVAGLIAVFTKDPNV